MKIISFSALGVILQGLFLTAFILVSRTFLAGLGKPLVIAVAILSMILLLWWGIKNARDYSSLCALPPILAVGYIFAFHLIGTFAFPSLLRDMYFFNSASASSIFRVILVLILLYGVATVLLAVVRSLLTRDMKRSIPLLIMIIALSSCLHSAQKALGSHSSAGASDLCKRLSSIKRIPFEHEAVNDELYNKIMAKGQDAVPCLIDQLTNETRMADPRSEPTFADFRVGDLAFFLLLRITNVPFEQMLPNSVKAKLKEEGVYAYFRYTGTPRNRATLQHKWKAWLKAQTPKPQL